MESSPHSAFVESVGLPRQQMVAIEDDMDLEPLNLGLIAAHYYVAYTTIELFAKSITGKTKMKVSSYLCGSSITRSTGEADHKSTSNCSGLSVVAGCMGPRTARRMKCDISARLPPLCVGRFLSEALVKGYIARRVCWRFCRARASSTTWQYGRARRKPSGSCLCTR